MNGPLWMVQDFLNQYMMANSVYIKFRKILKSSFLMRLNLVQRGDARATKYGTRSQFA